MIAAQWLAQKRIRKEIAQERSPKWSKRKGDTKQEKEGQMVQPQLFLKTNKVRTKVIDTSTDAQRRA